MHKIYNQFVGETVYYEKLASGLEVYVMPKEQFSKKYAFFGTRYGGMSNHFEVDGQKIQMPEGIAHFLEHQIFEDSDESTFEKFEKIGANVNAYTSSISTVYYFDTVDHFEKGLEYLMDCVQHTSIDAETVEKEKGIIVQEINMYKDELDWELTMNLYEGMYQKHPIKNDIAGTEESVNSITAEQILACFDYFYSPENMVMFVYGDVDPEKVIRQVDAQQTEAFKHKKTCPKIIFPEEPYGVTNKSIRVHREVPKDRFLMGFKSGMTFDEVTREKYVAALRIANDLIFGKSSAFYDEAMQLGLITESIDMDIQIGNGFAFAAYGAESSRIHDLQELIRKTLAKAIETGIRQEDFIRNKRKLLGRMLISFNSLQALANNFTYHKMKRGDLFSYVEILQTLTFEDVNEALSHFYDLDNYTLSEMLMKEEA